MATRAKKLLEEAKATLKTHFVIVDWLGVVLILAIAVSHYTPGEMLWVRIIGASRSGKTELLRAIARHPDCVELEVFTPGALRGGYTREKKEQRLLHRLNGKLAITKDAVAIMTVRKDLKNEVFGLLRPLKDGKITADFGSDEGHLEQAVKFDWLLATTDFVERERTMESLLGERFIDLRWRPGNREEMAIRAGENNPYLDTKIRPAVAEAIGSLMDEAKTRIANIDLTSDEIRMIAGYADCAAWLRTPVQRDRKHEISSSPEPEIGTDLTQGFCRICKGLKLLDLELKPYLNRLVMDAMPKSRSKVVESLAKGITRPEAMATAANLPMRIVYWQLEELQLLNVIGGNNDFCTLFNTYKKYICVEERTPQPLANPF